MLQPIKTIEISKIFRETTTKGSAPLFTYGVDDSTYFVKTTGQQNPSAEIINELLCGYFAQCWSLHVPEFCLAVISKEVVDTYLQEVEKMSDFYSSNFYENVMFGSKQVSPAFELEQFINVSKRELKLFSNPLDFLKIGAFDLWVGNKDRRPENPNILIGGENGLFDFHPIDHAAAFAYLTNYKEVREVLLHIEPKNCILSTILAKTISSFVTHEDIKNLKDDINNCITNTIENFDFIFEQVPKSWGLSKKSKEHLKFFFSDKVRNKTIIEHFLSYLK
ncbi:HipA family kinase [Pedobacter helvus]|uniref:HipA family kinase n=1 Tax=Pedobacter helvus TaxID=2563444 RepID=A0ABW9JHR8_9SPHI|nr:HipA family kinase [Pedobacter ureilyticus]